MTLGSGSAAGRAGTTSVAGAAKAVPAGSAARPSSVPDAANAFGSRFAAARPLDYEANVDKLNHGVFRYPAKFHPPIARRLIELFTSPGDTVLDPFCGSGTLLAEAMALGRNGVGGDVDPLAVFVAAAKTAPFDAAVVAPAMATFDDWLADCRRDDLAEYGGFDRDVGEDAFELAKGGLQDWIPPLPNIDHWFRRRAILQLARIRQRIAEESDEGVRTFLLLCFASIVRGSSNADPVPISGLEVTSHMLAKEAKGRLVDPWLLMSRRLKRSFDAMSAFASARKDGASVSVTEADARSLDVTAVGVVQAAITSPPYLTAVDYYRRHTLEMYWLGLTDGRATRLELMARYIGRDRVGLNRMGDDPPHGTAVTDRWLGRFGAMKPERERAFRHYCDGMARTLAGLAEVVVPGGPIVVAAGDVRFCGQPVSMLELLRDLAGDGLVIYDHLWYPIHNRYMSYSRKNEADIAADHVLAFRRV